MLALVLAVLTVLGAAAAPAGAITGGEPDGGGHPNVGVIVFYDATGRYRCSATLVSPTVLVTAAHCTEGTLGLDPRLLRVGHRREPAEPVPRRRRPVGRLHRCGDRGRGYLSGTAYSHPEYSDFTDIRNWNDVGVIVLDEPVTGITPCRDRTRSGTWTSSARRSSTGPSSRSSATGPRSASRSPGRRSRSR
jgi:hypothetical protein